MMLHSNSLVVHVGFKSFILENEYLFGDKIGIQRRLSLYEKGLNENLFYRILDVTTSCTCDVVAFILYDTLLA